ncbi:MAG: DivIVA domain-containing protein [Clostridiales bacterium]|nr:DivIVA domain-containing protein [Clostridiales bacterium]
MITPVEIQAKVFKSGLGYNKEDVDSFLGELLVDYEELYKSNADLNDRISVLEEKLGYYKSLEKTLQKALILAEKTAEDTVNAANKERDLIIDEAKLKARSIVAEAKSDLEKIHKQSIELLQQYEVYKAQFKQLAKAQFELLESDAFDIQIANLKSLVSEEAAASLSQREEAKRPYVEVKEMTDQGFVSSNEGLEVKEDTISQEQNQNDYDIEFFSLSDDE